MRVEELKELQEKINGLLAEEQVTELVEDTDVKADGEVDGKVEPPKPKQLEVVLERYLDCQKELCEILLVVFARLNKLEGI